MTTPSSNAVGGRPIDATAPGEVALEASVQAFLDRHGGRLSPHGRAVEEARAAFEAIQRAAITPIVPALVEDRVFPVGPTGRVPVRIYRPPEQEGRLPPVTLYLHGGGWIMGGTATHDRLMREISAGAGTAVVFVDYALAPEARYPVQIEQAYAVLEHLAANAGALDLDATRIAVAGDDAGGAMAAAVAMLAKQRRGPAILFQLLFCPIVAAPREPGPDAAGDDGPWLTRVAVRRMLDAVFTDATGRTQATALPLLATAQQLNDLPGTLVITAEFDLLRDDAEAYTRRLAYAGVPASSTRYNGTIHDFVVLNALAASPAARGAIAQACAALSAAFNEA
jgi:acetyl esterase